jgi:hypothetical protein
MTRRLAHTAFDWTTGTPQAVDWMTGTLQYLFDWINGTLPSWLDVQYAFQFSVQTPGMPVISLPGWLTRPAALWLRLIPIHLPECIRDANSSDILTYRYWLLPDLQVQLFADAELPTYCLIGTSLWTPSNLSSTVITNNTLFAAQDIYWINFSSSECVSTETENSAFGVREVKILIPLNSVFLLLVALRTRITRE